jgi:hypothetical protein
MAFCWISCAQGQFSLSLSLSLYIYIYIYIHTHTHACASQVTQIPHFPHTLKRTLNTKEVWMWPCKTVPHAIWMYCCRIRQTEMRSSYVNDAWISVLLHFINTRQCVHIKQVWNSLWNYSPFSSKIHYNLPTDCKRQTAHAVILKCHVLSIEVAQYGTMIQTCCHYHGYTSLQYVLMSLFKHLSYCTITLWNGRVQYEHCISAWTKPITYKLLTLPVTWHNWKLWARSGMDGSGVKSISKAMRPVGLWDVEDPTLSRQSAHS